MTKHDPSTLLVGVANPATIPRLMGLAADLALQTKTPIVVTNVVVVPGQIGLSAVKDSPMVRAARQLLSQAIRAASGRKVKVRGVVEVAREPSEGMVAAAESQKAQALLVGYSDQGTGSASAERAFDRIMHRVARAAACDLVVAKFRSEKKEKVLVPVAGGGTNLRLTGALAKGLAESRDAEIQFLHVTAPDKDAQEAERQVTVLLEQKGLKDLGPLEVVSSDDPVATILERCKDYDVAIVGTDARASIAEAIFGSPAEDIADQAPCTVLLVRAVPQP